MRAASRRTAPHSRAAPSRACRPSRSPRLGALRSRVRLAAALSMRVVVAAHARRARRPTRPAADSRVAGCSVGHSHVGRPLTADSGAIVAAATAFDCADRRDRLTDCSQPRMNSSVLRSARSRPRPTARRSSTSPGRSTGTTRPGCRRSRARSTACSIPARTRGSSHARAQLWLAERGGARRRPDQRPGRRTRLSSIWAPGTGQWGMFEALDAEAGGGADRHRRGLAARRRA